MALLTISSAYQETPRIRICRSKDTDPKETGDATAQTDGTDPEAAAAEAKKEEYLSEVKRLSEALEKLRQDEKDSRERVAFMNTQFGNSQKLVKSIQDLLDAKYKELKKIQDRIDNEGGRVAS